MKMIRMAALIAAAAAAASKAKDYARENPDKASETLDKVEAFVAGKAGRSTPTRWARAATPSVRASACPRQEVVRPGRRARTRWHRRPPRRSARTAPRRSPETGPSPRGHHARSTPRSEHGRARPGRADTSLIPAPGRWRRGPHGTSSPPTQEPP